MPDMLAGFLFTVLASAGALAVVGAILRRL
jgi:hypothetical protein